MEGQEVVFNINNYIKVKLTEKGYQHYRDYHNQYMPEELVKPLEHFKAKADAEGYCKFQAWCFIQMFGDTIKSWEVPIFSPDIIIVFPDSIETQLKKLVNEERN